MPVDTVGWDLVRRAQEGDKDAFGELYARNRDVVYAYIHHRVPCPYTSEDLAADTWVRALRALPTLREASDSPTGWFVTIAGNIVRDHQGSWRVRRIQPTADTPDTADDTNGPEPVAVRHETSDAVRALVARLDGDQRRVIELRYLRRMSVGEVALVMRRSPGAVKALSHRAMTRLRREARTVVPIA